MNWKQRAINNFECLSIWSDLLSCFACVGRQWEWRCCLYRNPIRIDFSDSIHPSVRWISHRIERVSSAFYQRELILKQCFQWYIYDVVCFESIEPQWYWFCNCVKHVSQTHRPRHTIKFFRILHSPHHVWNNILERFLLFQKNFCARFKSGNSTGQPDDINHIIGYINSIVYIHISLCEIHHA